MIQELSRFLATLLILPFASTIAGQNAHATKRSSLHISQLTCEGFANPLGIDITQPRLSWQMESPRRGQRQTAYQILVAASPEVLKRNQGDLWNTGRVESDQSIHVEYQGAPLESGKVYHWKVRLWDREGVASEWSKPALWTMGFLKGSDWKGKWIGLDEVDKTYHLTGTHWIWFPEGQPSTTAPAATRYFRRTVNLPEGFAIKEAHFYVTGDNECNLYVNGMQVASTKNHAVVTDVDVAGNLHGGANLLAASVRNMGDAPNPAGLIGLLHILYADGTTVLIPTDAHWQASDREFPGWQSPDFSDTSWAPALVLGPAGMPPWGEMYGPEDRRLPARWLRKEFDVGKKLRRATAYLSGLGLSELYLNGKKVGDHVLSPALSEYAKRVFYVTHDVTASLKRGRNAVGVVLGNGRYFAPRVHQPTFTQTYGSPKLLLQLVLEFEDGTSAEVVSDETWKMTTEGPIRANSEYDGEEYDARMELEGWATGGFQCEAWQAPQVVAAPGGVLRSQMIKPIRVTQTLKPLSCTEVRPGVFIFDMGQNMVGWCRLTVRGPRGTEVSLRHAETLTSNGELYLDNLRGAKVTDLYMLKGQGTEVYEPRFTYHGFRYVEVRGFPGRPDLSALEGRVVHDDVESAGEFNCSHPLINRIYQNVVWGVRGNYRSIPTDCPQRDERQGWLGDRSAESRGETYLFDVSALYAKWVQDMADAQKENGSVSDVCPSYWPLYNDNVTWPSSTVIIPGSLLDQYADRTLIRRHYPSMVKWIDHMCSYIEENVITKDTYGDWCVPPEDPKLIHSNDPKRKTAPGILSTCFLYYDVSLMSRYAALLGRTDDVQRFTALASRLRNGLNEKFYSKTLGYYDNGSQTSCVLPLAFDMVPPDQRDRVFGHLVLKVTEESKGHIGTGLIGGQWLNRVLSRNGRPDLVYSIATQTAYPGWGYMVEKGATTIWELWNGDTADPAMNSGNHVMLVGDFVIWLFEELAGIASDPGLPGFKHVLMRPTPVGDLQYAKAAHMSPYGRTTSEWKNTAKDFEWTITLPPNTTATVSIPAKSLDSITEDGKSIHTIQGVKDLHMEGSRAVCTVESGTYHFLSVHD